MKDRRTKGIDRFGRNYPDKVVLCNGDILIGQASIESHSPDGQYSIPIFRIIENLDEWIANRIQYGTKKISIEGSEIKEISTFNKY